jgi:hypothetical protein
MAIQLDQMKRQKLEFDLEEFTKQVRAFEAATLNEQLRIWSQNDMWRLHSVLFPDGRAREHHISPSAPAADWLARYQTNRTHEFPALLEFQKLGIDWVDDLLKLGDSSNTDLDLHLRQGGAWTNFRTPNGIPGADYQEDQRGDRHPMSVERIQLTPQAAPAYSILVHHYSGKCSLQKVGASVSIFYGKGVENLDVPDGVGDWWHVADLRIGSPTPILVNRIIS